MNAESAARRIAGPHTDAGALLRVDRAAAELRRGGIVLIEGQGAAALTLAAETVVDDSLHRLLELAAGRVALALTGQRGGVLGLGPGANGFVTLTVPPGSPASTLRRLADPTADQGAISPRAESAEPTDLMLPAIELAKLSRLLPAVIIGVPAPRKAAGLAEWAAAQDLLRVGACDIADYQSMAARTLQAVGEARVPLIGAENARIVAFRPSDGGTEHLAIIVGAPKPAMPVLTRLHSECLTGDLLGSLRCDCGDQLRGAIAEIGRQGSGILLYLAQEGRGIGLVNKLRAYRLQDRGADTIEANEQLGFEPDERIYLPAAQILRQLGFPQVRLMTNNPQKVAGLVRCGIVVSERVAHVFPANGHNERYLETKASRFGHIF